jgi:hypothetical protein
MKTRQAGARWSARVEERRKKRNKKRETKTKKSVSADMWHQGCLKAVDEGRGSEDRTGLREGRKLWKER